MLGYRKRVKSKSKMLEVKGETGRRGNLCVYFSAHRRRSPVHLHLRDGPCTLRGIIGSEFRSLDHPRSATIVWGDLVLVRSHQRAKTSRTTAGPARAKCCANAVKTRTWREWNASAGGNGAVFAAIAAVAVLRLWRWTQTSKVDRAEQSRCVPSCWKRPSPLFAHAPSSTCRTPREYDRFPPFPGSTWSLPRHSGQTYAYGGVLPSDGSFKRNVADDNGDWDADADDGWEERESSSSPGVSCISQGGENVDALGGAQRSRSTDFRRRLDAAPGDEPTSPVPEILTPLTPPSLNSLMSSTGSAGRQTSVTPLQVPVPDSQTEGAT
jgi:hypothetical protein